MNSRERVELALNHKEADVIPSDLGAVVMSSLHTRSYANLRRYLGFPEVNIRLRDVVQQLVIVDDDVREHFRVDVTGFNPNPSTRSAAVVIKDEIPGYTSFTDEWGIGWKMPKDEGWYYDVNNFPWRRDDLTVKDIENYPWPDPADPARFIGLRAQVQHAVEVEQRAVIMGGVCAGFVEMAGWMFGYENYLANFVTAPELLECFFDKLLDYKMAFWEKMLDEVGDLVSAVMESDDLGSQRDLLFSPRMYRQFVKPRHKKLYAFIKSKSRAKLFLHSCGAIRKVIPDLIEEGVDILNPVQVSCVGMDSAELKREYGNDLTFWGGGVDTQSVLGNGTVQEVRDEVRKRIDDFAPGGGFIFATVHAIQGNVPPQNVEAVWKTLQEYGVYQH
jgi:uroporphyrinogen decarboxylase